MVFETDLYQLLMLTKNEIVHSFDGIPETTFVIGSNDNHAGKFGIEYVNGRAGLFPSLVDGSMNDIFEPLV